VVGQENAIAELLACYKRFAAGLAPTKRPAGIYLMLGPTGSGKTLLAEAFHEAVTDKPGTLLKIDGGEFTQSHEVAKLTGSPPGYLGHKETAPRFT
jgi:ATP-dependent Clp protease ATP-binding subunit ClpA